MAQGPSQAAVGLYGKHPSAREFFRLGGRAEIDALDGWLSQALASAERAVESWPQVYAGAPVVGFIHESGTSMRHRRCLVGAIAPSRDEIGRRYPLILFAAVDHTAAIRHYPALPHHPFIAAAARLLSQRERLDDGQLIAAVGRLRPPTASDLDAARQAHGRYVDSTPRSDAFVPLFRGTPPDQDRRAVGMLRVACSAITSTGAVPRYGIRCPQDSRRPTETAGLWLDLARHMTPLAVLPSVLWTERALVLFFGNPSRAALAALWSPSWQDDGICDLSRAEGNAMEPPLVSERPLRTLLP